MKPTDALKIRLRILAGLPPTSPTDNELGRIIQRVSEVAIQRTPTEADWKAAATAVVPLAGRHKYAAEDMSDLNELLEQILRGTEGD